MKLGHIDILVNNAGEMTNAPITELSDDLWEHSIKLHLTAAFQLTRACIPSMISNRWGRIINVSSQAAFTGSSFHAHYSAAKAGLLGFTFSLAKELGGFEVTANAVSPGRISTDMIAAHLPRLHISIHLEIRASGATGLKFHEWKPFQSVFLII